MKLSDVDFSDVNLTVTIKDLKDSRILEFYSSNGEKYTTAID